MKPLNGIVMTEELREELDQAAIATQQAYATARGGGGGGGGPGSPVSGGPNDDHGAAGLVLTPNSIAANLEDLLAEKVDRSKERDDENKLSPKVSVMKPILRFLQLLCENHNRSLQNLLRDQGRYSVLSQVSQH